ncbi:MAG: domain S-box protein [Frankiales bacterium]|nr:domain S-box protein [Frankiales bacterium]
MTALRKVVLLVALLGLGLQLLVREQLGDAGAIVPLGDLLGDLPPLVLVAGMLLLAVFGDLLYVPVRRGESTEELTLYEAAVVAAVLLLPARDALWVPIAAIALTSLMLRRDAVKSVFNIANFAACTGLLVAVVHTMSGPGQGLSSRTVLAMVVGLLAFCALNLLLLALVLKVLGEGETKQVLVDGSRLALVTAATTIALTGGAVVAGEAAPSLLPFSLVPAVALLTAYRATAQSSEQRQRSARLLALSHVLAGRVDPDEMLPAFLSQCRQVFGAEVAVALIEPSVAPGHDSGLTASDERGAGASQGPTTDVERALLGSRGGEAAVLTGPLPHGWVQAIVAPLEADGEPLGALVLASREKSLLGEAELTLLTPLASALAVALRGAAHLRRLTEETSKLQAVVDQSSDGILVLDGAGSVQLWSPALTALTGRSEAEALGRPLSDTVRTTNTDGAECDAFTAGRELLTPDAPQATVELTLRRHDGEQRVIRCAHAGVFADGELLRDVVIVHDITRERQVERLKADFIATVSHELRTPVTPIKGYADLLRRRGDAMTPERRNECLAVISDRCDHLARLVEDLLLASRISATEGSATAQVDLGSGDLVALVQRAAGDFGHDGERVHLSLPADPVPVTCDPMRVIQVLTNLIGNALKYSPAGSPVQVALAVEGEQAYVDVADHGRGIPADQLERVFEKFHRVEDPMRMTTGGTGLGLYIARQLAGAMGGTLQCASTLGTGSVFRFSLKRAHAQPLRASPLVPAAVNPVPVTLTAGSTGLVPTPRPDTAAPRDARLQAS